MRSAQIFYGDDLAGILVETNGGEYTFQYHKTYVDLFPDQFLTFSMPVSSAMYVEKRLFPFFEGLIPEGWLLDLASDGWKINRNDRMGLLMACCGNCIGAVSVQPILQQDEE